MFGSSDGRSSPEIGGLSFTSTGGLSCPNAAGGGVLCCASAGACPAGSCPQAAIEPTTSTTSTHVVWRMFIIKSLGDHDRVAGFQYQVLVDGFALDQRPVVHGNLLLFAA